MLQVFCGNDFVKVREAAFSVVESLEKKGATLISIDADSFESGIFTDLSAGESLFGESYVYLIDTPSSKKDFHTEVADSLSVLAESPHTFIVIEGALLAPEKKKLTKHAEKLEEFKATAGERFNTFSLTDALAKKDKRQLWSLLHEAKLSGIAIEEIVGVLWWQLKTLRLSALTNTPEEAGMKGYPYQKAKRSLSTFKEGELERLSHSLLSITHQSRLGDFELDLALERWILRM